MTNNVGQSIGISACNRGGNGITVIPSGCLVLSSFAMTSIDRFFICISKFGLRFLVPLIYLRTGEAIAPCPPNACLQHLARQRQYVGRCCSAYKLFYNVSINL